MLWNATICKCEPKFDTRIAILKFATCIFYHDIWIKTYSEEKLYEAEHVVKSSCFVSLVRPPSFLIRDYVSYWEPI